MKELRCHTASASPSKGDFERTAREQCEDILRVVREQYAPPTAIEALVILGFMRGAGWALGVETPRVPETSANEEPF